MYQIVSWSGTLLVMSFVLYIIQSSPPNLLVCHLDICCSALNVAYLQINILTFQRPAFAYVKAHKKTPLKIHFIYSGKKEIYCTFKTCCIISVYFLQNIIYSIILSKSTEGLGLIEADIKV